MNRMNGWKWLSIFPLALFAGLLVSGYTVRAQGDANSLDKAIRAKMSSGNPFDKTTLLKIYEDVETHLPKRNDDAEAMQPRVDDSYVHGRLVNGIRKNLLHTLNDLRGSVRAGKTEDFGNPWEVAYVEYQVGRDLNEVYEALDAYQDSLENSSMSESDQRAIMARQLPDSDAVNRDGGWLSSDLDVRLLTMAVAVHAKKSKAAASVVSRKYVHKVARSFGGWNRQ